MNGKKAIREVARKSGVSKREVYQEILTCLKMAQENDDPEIKALWAAIPRKGKSVTPEELIEYIAHQIKSKH